LSWSPWREGQVKGRKSKKRGDQFACAMKGGVDNAQGIFKSRTEKNRNGEKDILCSAEEKLGHIWDWGRVQGGEKKLAYRQRVSFGGGLERSGHRGRVWPQPAQSTGSDGGRPGKPS